MKAFSIDKAISDAWKNVKANPKYVLFFWIAVLSPILVTTFFNALAGEESSMSFVVSILANVVGIILSIGVIRLSLNVFEGKKLEFSNLYQDYRLIIRYFIANVLLTFAIFAALIPFFIILGLLFFFARDYMIYLIVPGVATVVSVIYLAIRWTLWPYFLIDKNQGAIQSLRSSWQVTKGNVLRFILLYLVQMIIVLLGFVALFVGLIVAIPVVSLIVVFVYKQLTEEVKAKSSRNTKAKLKAAK